MTLTRPFKETVETRARRDPAFHEALLAEDGDATLEYKGYRGAVEVEDGMLVGRVTGSRDVITFEGRTLAEAKQAFQESVDDYLSFCGNTNLPQEGGEA